MKELITILATLFVLLGLVGAVIVIADIRNGHRQRMPIMEIVWPLTALWGSWLGVWAYFRFGRQDRPSPIDELMDTDMLPQKQDHPKMEMDKSMGMEMPAHTMNGMGGMPGMSKMGMVSQSIPSRSVLLSALHCGAGCVLADLIGESLAIVLPLSIGLLWGIEYLLALMIGIGFQYAAMQQMDRGPVGDTLRRALKADILSLTAWQLGMYAWMGLNLFVLYPGDPDRHSWSFWFMLQIAMFAGLGLSYPVNRWLISRGIKHPM